MDPATARARLESMLTDLDRSIAILRDENADPAHSAAGLSDHDRVEAALEAMERHRGAVHAALDRLGDGTYGRCVGCGAPVPEGRLEARPDAARCVPCQSAHDRTTH